MEFEVIASLPELTEFDDRNTTYTGVKFRMKYWQHCKVVACYSPTREMIGGYALVLEPPFRSLLTLSQETEAYTRFCQEVPLTQMMEVTGLWIKPGTMRCRDRAKFFMTMVDDICECVCPYFVYVYNLNRPNLQKLYGKLNSKVLFRGQLPSEKPNAHPVSIEYALIADLKREISSDRYRFNNC